MRDTPAQMASTWGSNPRKPEEQLRDKNKLSQPVSILSASLYMRDCIREIFWNTLPPLPPKKRSQMANDIFSCMRSILLFSISASLNSFIFSLFMKTSFFPLHRICDVFPPSPPMLVMLCSNVKRDFFQ